MFEYYKGEPDFDIQFLKNIYNKIITDLIINNNNNNYNGEILLDKNEVINLNLNANIEEEDYKKKLTFLIKKKIIKMKKKKKVYFLIKIIL